MNEEISILVVEDSQAQARLIRELLRESPTPITTEHATTLAAAIECIRQQDYHLILLDLGLPDSSGLDTLLRVKETGCNIPVVVFTGFEDDAVAVEAVKQGAQDYILKNEFDARLLMRTVRYAIERHRIIVEREKVEAALRCSESNFRILIMHHVDGLVITDLGGVIRFVNPAALELFQCREEDLLGTVSATISATESITEMEVVRPDGQSVTTEVGAAMIEWEGEPARLLSLRDVTEQRKMQQKLVVTDRLSSVGELVAGVAHEINNPLTAISGFSEILLTQQHEPDVEDGLQTIYQETQRVIKIVDNLLKFGRRQSLWIQGVDINDLLEGILEIRGYEQRNNSIKLVKQLGSDLPHVAGDSVQLKQVLFNLIVNAEYFTETGGAITVATEADGGVVRISVSDAGPGIPEANLERIFNPFFTTKPVGAGTGLGLSVCHGIVQEHKGDIYAYNHKDRGATFVVELPIPVEADFAGPPQRYEECLK